MKKDKQNMLEQALNQQLLGFFGLVNVELTDSPFGPLQSTLKHLEISSYPYQDMAPLKFNPLTIRVATDQDVTDYGTDVTADEDLIGIISFADLISGGAIPNYVALNSLFITQKFEENRVAGRYDLLLRTYLTTGVGAVQLTDYNRRITVNPKQAANSVLSFGLLPVVSAQLASYDESQDCYEAATDQSMGFYSPLRLAYGRQSVTREEDFIARTVIVVLKGQALIPQQSTIQPSVMCRGAFSTLAPQVSPMFNKAIRS